MNSRSYPSNEVETPVMAGANPIHTGSLSFPDHQSASYPSSAAFQPDTMTTTLHSSNIISASMLTPVTNPSSWAAKQNWARHQALIKQLYLYEKKPLAEVMRLMESQHGFKATVKMYKTHIKQWGLDKKNKEFEMRAIVRKNKQRADQGKGSIIRVRGQLRDFTEVVHYWDRKGVSIDDIIARQTASPTPEAVEFSTPVPSPILTPQVLAIPERMFRCIRDYFKGSFESGTWVRTEPISHCYAIKDEKNSGFYMQELVLQCNLACVLFSRNLFQEAGQTLIVATAQIKKILSAEQPQSLIDLFLLIYNVRRRKRDEMALILLRQFSTLGKVLLGSEHPLSRICDWIDLVYASDFDDVVLRCMESMADHFESFVGPMHVSTLNARLKFILIGDRKCNVRIQMLERLLGECEKALLPHDIQRLYVRSSLAHEYLEQNYLIEARKMSEETIAYSQYIQSTAARLHHQAENLYMLAWCQYALGEVDLAMANLHKAIELRISTQGPQGGLTRHRLLLLEDWYLEQGDWSSAAQMRDRRQKALESIDID